MLKMRSLEIVGSERAMTISDYVQDLFKEGHPSLKSLPCLDLTLDLKCHCEYLSILYTIKYRNPVAQVRLQ